MTAQEFACRQTEKALDLLFTFARKVPTDKLDWRPNDAGRSVLSQLQECAQTPLWYMRFFDKSFDHGFKSMEEMFAARSDWSFEDCERIARENTARLLEAMRNVPDEEMTREEAMPWGQVVQVQDCLMFHYWNLTYHTGQIGFIQTLYGDYDM